MDEPKLKDLVLLLTGPPILYALLSGLAGGIEGAFCSSMLKADLEQATKAGCYGGGVVGFLEAIAFSLYSARAIITSNTDFLQFIFLHQNISNSCPHFFKIFLVMISDFFLTTFAAAGIGLFLLNATEEEVKISYKQALLSTLFPTVVLAPLFLLHLKRMISKKFTVGFFSDDTSAVIDDDESVISTMHSDCEYEFDSEQRELTPPSSPSICASSYTFFTQSSNDSPTSQTSNPNESSRYFA